MKTVKINEKRLYSIISESIVKILKEEKNADIDNKVVNLISYLHNSQKPLREIHWNTKEYATHMVTDETIDNILEWEDSLAETFISDSNVELTINETKPSSKEYESIMEELCAKASEIKNNISENEDYDNLCAVLDEILEKSNQLIYKSKLN